MEINYKFKESVPGWMFFIDVSGSKIEFKNGSRYKKEFAAYLAAGNEIEPFETQEEKEARELKENDQALMSQKQACKDELDKTQYIVDGDCDFPQSDIDTEKARRKKIKAIMRGTKIVEIPKRSL
jgi:predicted phosphodiesterase